MRYCCPVSGSFVLLTDDSALSRWSMRPMQCVSCGGEHRLIRAEQAQTDSAA